MKKNNIKYLTKLIISNLLVLVLVTSCGFYKPVDARKVSPKASERVKANIEKGEGFSAKLWSIDLTGYNERLVETKTDASDPSWSSLLSN